MSRRGGISHLLGASFGFTIRNTPLEALPGLVIVVIRMQLRFSQAHSVISS